MRVFVAVGTSHFETLIRRMDEITPRIGGKVVMQVGHTRYRPKNADSFAFAPSLRDYIAASDIVISHGGFGLMTEALSMGKKVIGVENRDMFDNHQAELLEKFEQEGYIVWCRDPGLLEAAIREVAGKELRAYSKPECTIGERIREFLGVGSRPTPAGDPGPNAKGAGGAAARAATDRAAGR